MVSSVNNAYSGVNSVLTVQQSARGYPANSAGSAGAAAKDSANARQAQPAASQSPASGAALKGESVEQQFLNYLKKSPGQRMIEAWLKAHNLTEEDLEAMSPEKREAIFKQMAEDIENEVKRKAEARMNILA